MMKEATRFSVDLSIGEENAAEVRAYSLAMAVASIGFAVQVEVI